MHEIMKQKKEPNAMKKEMFSLRSGPSNIGKEVI
jgi:hypothetical protein